MISSIISLNHDYLSYIMSHRWSPRYRGRLDAPALLPIPRTIFLPVTHPTCVRHLIAERRTDRPEVLAVMDIMQAMPFQVRNNR
jgi:hypothetical protein